MRRLLSVLIGLVLCGSGVAVAQSGSFLEPFTGAPTAPLAYPTLAPMSAWDVTVHSRDPGTFYTMPAMQADHGSDCSAPPAKHLFSGNYADAVFQCSNHIMTALNGPGYAVIYLTPPALLDWTNGPATLTFDMSTLRTSERDWVNIYLSPYDEHKQLPLDIANVDLNGPPKDAINFRMDNSGGTIFRTYLDTDYTDHELQSQWFAPYENLLTPSAATRTTFQAVISRTHIKFGMPAYNFWWTDIDVPDLGYTQAVVQFGHHSYSPDKDCAPTLACVPNTWHWDNVSINPSSPFTITRAQERYVDPMSANRGFTFPSPAPAGAMLQVAGLADPGSFQYSPDNGATWITAAMQLTKSPLDPSKFQSYWTPLAEGVASILVRANGGNWGDWMLRDASVWSQVRVPRTPTPAVATATPVPPPTSTPVLPPTSTVPPAVTATALRTPTPLPSATPGAAGVGVRGVPPGWDWTIDAGTSDQAAVWGTPSGLAPPACDGTQAPITTPPVRDYGLWQCPDHWVWRSNTQDYGHQFLTAPALVDFSQGEAVISWDMSTWRQSVGRDWIELWVSPLAESVPNPDGRYYITAPAEAVYMRMDNPNNFRGNVVRNLVGTEINANLTNWASVLTPSPTRLDRFELHLSRTHVKFGMPAYNLWWTDTDVADLGWSQGIVQFGQAVYQSDLDGGATNWAFHLPTVAPSLPLTILRGNNQSVVAGNTAVTFPAPAPANTLLKFIGMGTQQTVSFDNGATFQRVPVMPSPHGVLDLYFTEGGGHYMPYQVAVPVGVQTVLFLGTDVPGCDCPWEVHDVAFYAGGSAPLATATPLPPTITPGPTATALPTATPRPFPTATPTGAPTATLVPGPQCAQVAIVNGGLMWNPQAPSTCPQ